MDCTQHAGVAATAICTRCDHPLCAACVNERNSRNFCADCAGFLDRRSTRRGQPGSAAPGPAAPQTPAAQDLHSGPAAPAAAVGDVYQGPPPASAGGPAPANPYQQQAPGDVYQGPPPAAASGLAPVNPYEQQAPGDVYQGPPPAAASGPAPANPYQQQAPGDVYGGLAPQGGPAAQGGPAPANPYQSQAPGADVYQDPAPGADVYQGPAPGGDVYQGPAPGGDVYQGEAQPGMPAGAQAAAPDPEAKEGSMGRGVLWGSAVGLITAGIWYAAVIFTGFQFGFLAILIGWLVGAATAVGVGRGGGDVAVLSLVIAAGSMIGGDYMINNYFYRKLTTDVIQEQEAFRDGHISDEDIALYLDTSVGELHAELSDEELEEFRQYLKDEVAAGDDYDLDEPEEPANLPLSQLPLWMGWWEYVFIFIGAVQAFRVPMGDEAG